MDQTTGEIRAGMRRDENAYDASNDPDMLQAQIAQTRRELSETIDQIQERLAPERLKREAEMSVQQATRQAQDAVREATIGKVERMMDSATETAGNWRMSMMGTIRQNPIPAAMIGLGLGWLLVESRSQSQMAGSYRQRGMYGQPYTTMGTAGEMGMEEEGMMERMGETAGQMQQRMGETAGQMQQRVGETAEQMQQRLSETAGQMQQRVSETAEEARMKAEQMQQQASERMEQMRYRLQQSSEEARHTMEQMMTENPLAVGVAALALGMGIGLLMPSTRAEDEMMGQYRDQFMEQAQHKAEETMEQVRTVAQEAQMAAKDAMKEVQEETKQAVEDVVHRTEEEARRQNIAGT